MAKKKDELDIRPDDNGKSNIPSAVDWQGKKAGQISEATAPAVLAALASDADKLKQILKGLDFSGRFSDADAMAKTQLAALSVFSMDSGNEGIRRKYTNALIETGAGGKTDLVLFCLEQLRHCAFKDQAGKIRSVFVQGLGRKDKNIADFAEMVVYEISL